MRLFFVVRNHIGHEGTCQCPRDQHHPHRAVVERQCYWGKGCKGTCANALEQNGSLTLLGWNECPIGAEGAKALAPTLEKNTTLLHELRLDQNDIGNDGKALASALKTNSSLQELWRNENDIGDEGALANALEKNSSLKTLWLETNHIGGARALGGALETNTIRMELGFQSIGEMGARALADALGVQKHHTLMAQCPVQLYHRGRGRCAFAHLELAATKP